jgi:spermidine synthase
LLSARLKDGGAFVVQSTSPLMARRSFWCVEETIRQSGFNTLPYHVTVPSFGEWGFILASKEPLSPPRTLPEGLQFLDEEMLPSLFHFPRDMQKVAVEPNRLNNQALVHYYEEEWSRYVS